MSIKKLTMNKKIKAKIKILLRNLMVERIYLPKDISKSKK